MNMNYVSYWIVLRINRISYTYLRFVFTFQGTDQFYVRLYVLE